VRGEGNLGRIGIDLPRALRDRRHRDNLILQDGDSVYIPQYNAVVNVTGAVNSPVAVSYVPGRSIDFYVNAAGGPARKADTRRAYVTQPNGKVEGKRVRALLPDGVPEPLPGSVVYVPMRAEDDERNVVAAIGSLAQVLVSLVAIVALISR
jgi:polysaccharide export outer membrane protein